MLADVRRHEKQRDAHAWRNGGQRLIQPRQRRECEPGARHRRRRVDRGPPGKRRVHPRHVIRRVIRHEARIAVRAVPRPLPPHQHRKLVRRLLHGIGRQHLEIRGPERRRVHPTRKRPSRHLRRIAPAPRRVHPDQHRPRCRVRAQEDMQHLHLLPRGGAVHGQVGKPRAKRAIQLCRLQQPRRAGAEHDAVEPRAPGQCGKAVSRVAADRHARRRGRVRQGIPRIDQHDEGVQHGHRRHRDGHSPPGKATVTFRHRHPVRAGRVEAPKAGTGPSAASGRTARAMVKTGNR